MTASSKSPKSLTTSEPLDMADRFEADIPAARAGDRQAIVRIISSLQDPWFRFCLSRLRDPTLARDATQESARRLLEGLAGFQRASRLETWAMGIALNVCREMTRKERPANRAPSPSLAEPAAQRHDLDVPLDVNAAVSALPDRQAEVVTLRYLHGLTTIETAEAMGIATGTVKATLNHAMKTLRQRLAAWQEGNGHDAT